MFAAVVTRGSENPGPVIARAWPRRNPGYEVGITSPGRGVATTGYFVPGLIDRLLLNRSPLFKLLGVVFVHDLTCLVDHVFTGKTLLV